MKQIIHFFITKDGKYYTASCVELAIVTDGKTLDKLIANIHEATALHMEALEPKKHGFVKSPLISINMDLPQFA